MRAIAIIIFMFVNYQYQFCETTIFIFHKRFHQISRLFDWSNRWFVYRQIFNQHQFSFVHCCYDNYKHFEIKFYFWSFEIRAVAKTIYCWIFRRSNATFVFVICRQNWQQIAITTKKNWFWSKIWKNAKFLDDIMKCSIFVIWSKIALFLFVKNVDQLFNAMLSQQQYRNTKNAT